MNKFSFLLNKPLFLFFIGYSSCISASDITEKLITSLIDKSLPEVLYEHKAVEWPMGVYDLTVKKVDSAGFTSDTTKLSFSLPINMDMTAQVKQKLLGSTLTLQCSSHITTKGYLHVTPKLNNTLTTAKVSIDIPVPETFMNCEGLKLPITAMLVQLIKHKKGQWEAKAENKINLKFKEIGL